MTAQLSREQLLEIVETDHVQCGDASAMARMLLAGMDSEPVAWRWSYGGTTTWRLLDTKPMPGTNPNWTRVIEPLYAAPPAPVAAAPDGLRMALSNAGIAAPESDEVLFATHEKYVQLLVDWVKDRKMFAPAPVAVHDEVVESLDLLLNKNYFRQWVKEPRGYVGGSIAVRDLVNVVLFANACRAAMQAEPVSAAYKLPDGWISEAKKLAELHGISFVVFRKGEEPQCADPSKVIISFTDEGLGYPGAPVTAATVPDGWKLVPIEPTDEMCEAGFKATDKYPFERFDNYREMHSCWALPRYKAMLAAAPAAPEQQNAPQNIPENIPGGWIKCSERMPEENEEQEVLACFKGGDISTLYYFEGRWDDAYGIVPIRQDVTHWMPLPAAPEQEV